MIPENTPILFLVFNRPDLTKAVFGRIREQRPEQLYVAADGPRRDREGESELCEATRRVTENVDWDCEVHRLYRDANLGCKLAVSSAITWFFGNVEYGIILEDDCLPDPSFYQFCAELLKRYRDNPQIGIISGYCPIQADLEVPESYYFSKYPHIWGWATWRRVWERYDVDLQNWSCSPAQLTSVFPNRLVRNSWAAAFDSVKSGSIDTWDFQLIYLHAESKLLAVTPSVNLVENIGFDSRATHTLDASARARLPPAYSMKFPLVHPERIECNQKLDRLDEVECQGITKGLYQHYLRMAVHKLRCLKRSLQAVLSK
jgi:hypothetical protein